MKSGKISFLSILLLITALFSHIYAGEPVNLLLKIVDKDSGFPMAASQLTIKIDDDETTDKTAINGTYQISLDDNTPEYFRISVRHDGYVPINLTWQNTNGKMVVPENYTLKMEKGTSIGCTILNEDGMPVEGTKVNLLVPNDSNFERVAIWDHQVTTDSEGKWHCDIMPSELRDVWIKLEHPEYVSDSMYGSTPKPSMENLRDMTGTMIMKKGLIVEGYVRDTDGKGIVGAEVAQGSDRWGSDYPLTTTNGDGYFSFINSPEGEMILTASVPDGLGSSRSCQPDNNPTERAKKKIFYSPDLKQISVTKDMKPVVFTLEKGKTMTGKIVDKDGNPLKDIPISADTWRTHRSISWKGKTNEDGIFTWYSAPSDQVLYDIYPRDYMSVRNKTMTAGKEEYVITMIPKLEVSGLVTDAQTGELINNVTFLRGIVWNESRTDTHWERSSSNSIVSTDGTYNASFSFPRYGHKLLAQADGYLPQESRMFTDDEGNIEINFALEKGTGITGTAFLPDGSPAVNTEYSIATISSPLNIEGKYFQSHNENKIYKTDENGKFQIPPQLDNFTLVILHENGYAEVNKQQLTEKTDITLTQWARATGNLKIGNSLGANIGVGATPQRPYNANSPHIWFGNRTITNSDGNFEVKYLPAGDITIYREIKLSQFTSCTHGRKAKLTPGKTTRFIIGGTGRPVKGRFISPKNYAGDIPLTNISFNMRLKQFQPDYPADFPDWDEEKQKEWLTNLANSPEYKKQEEDREKKYAYYNTKIEADGSFYIPDVEDGDYTVNIQIFKPDQSNHGWGEKIGSASKDFTIAPMPDGRSDEVLDLGDIVIKPKKNVALNDAAPEFKAQTLDGKEVKLSDYKGKYILLDFWATWCGPCVGEISNMKAAYEKYKDNSKFAMLSFSFDSTVQPVEKMLEKDEIKWDQCIDIKGFQSDAAAAYGIEGIPSIWLISPDGKIIAKGLRGEAIMQELDKHLN